MIVLAKLAGVTGEFNKVTGSFTPRAWSPAELERFSLANPIIVMAKLRGVTGFFNMTTEVFTPGAWSPEETARYETMRGPEKLAEDEQIVRNQETD